MTKVFEWCEPGREQLRLELNVENGQIMSLEMNALGCLDFLNLCQKMKTSLLGHVKDLALPEGSDHCAIIWREIIEQIKEQWHMPVEHEELCHCRRVSTEKVDRAIVYGAQTVSEVRKRTSANTGCGTCKPDVESLIENRLRVS